jgi:hypothetical protein
MAQNISKGPMQVHPTEDIPTLVLQLNDVFRQLRDELDKVQSLRGASIDEFAVTNASSSRTFNASTVTTAQLASVVATLINDLKASYGIS